MKLIKVKVFPESKRAGIKKKGKDEFLVKVKEKTERGEANKGAIEVLADYFNLGKGKIRLMKGGRKRNKIFKIYD